MIKAELLSQLENAKNNFILVLAAISLFSNEKAKPLLEESLIKFGKYTVQFNQVVNMMIKKEDRTIACKEFANMGLRILIKETFELIKTYAKETSQKEKFEAWPNYLFAKTIRNALSHDFKVNFQDKKELKKLPILLRDKIITERMDNTFLELSFFGYVEAWELFGDMKDFVILELN